MTGMIITARHGRPDVDRTVRITAREYGPWWANYDLAGLAPGQEPPQGLIDIASNAELVLSSTLPRAIETASKVVQGKRDVPQDSIFVEAPLPPPPVPGLKLTPTTWGVISRSFWFFGFAPDGVENHWAAQRRVRAATDRLIQEAQGGGDVLLCAHGYFNWMVHRHIIKCGWELVEHQGHNHYWSYRAYKKRGSAASLSSNARPSAQGLAAP